MSESIEYGGYDPKKVGLLIGIIAIAIIILTALFGLFDIKYDFPKIEFPKTENTESQQQEIDFVQQNTDQKLKLINENYIIYLDRGISADDIVDIQTMPCSLFGQNMTSEDPKYIEILQQRSNECLMEQEGLQ